ncbi:hypothetical protein [Actinophytocola sp. NPDC049390]|uniref:hypothetical protein n=1 Tax=Actinophytocola sp. NPDC049390 TaxID=3363894 RepID=UPI0037946B23
MSRSRSAVFTTRIALLASTAAITVAVPLLGATSASAGEDPPPPPPTTTATTEGHDWNN